MRRLMTLLATSVVTLAAVLLATAGPASARTAVVFGNYCPFPITVSSGTGTAGDTVVVQPRRASSVLTYDGVVTYRAVNSSTGALLRSGTVPANTGQAVRVCSIAP